MSFWKRGPSLSEIGNSSLPSGLTPEVIISFYEALDCPRSLTAAILYKYSEYNQLVSLEAIPSQYLNADSFRDAHLASSFLTKSRFLETSFDRKQLAIDKFNKFEDGCAEVNTRFASYSLDRHINLPNGALLEAMRRKIGKILGEFDPLELFDLSSWGPGVSTLIKGDETFAAKKFQFETGITRDLYPLVKDLFPLTYPSWWALLESKQEFPSFQIGNQVVTVPKTSKIDRVIAIEPGLNLWFQLGLGRMIRRRLGRFGVDLTDQTRNQRLAKMGSFTNHLATVDFSSASDSIAANVVKELFNSRTAYRWLEVMDVIRSKYGTIDSKVFRWNKFSSMGNGFTFDLETLIFYAAALVVCEKHQVSSLEVSVYGDDVVIPSVVYGSFCSLCEFLGFTVNQEKSFSSGPFRESCGSHYYEGVDCKPLYLEDTLDLPRRVFTFANTLRLRSHFYPLGYCEKRFSRLFYYLIKSVPKKIRFRVPAMWNSRSSSVEPLEGGFISNFDEACPQYARDNPLYTTYEGYIVRHLAWLPIKVEVSYTGLLLARIAALEDLKDKTHLENFLEVSTVDSGNENPLRGRTKCRVISTLVRQWYNLGPWL